MSESNVERSLTERIDDWIRGKHRKKVFLSLTLILKHYMDEDDSILFWEYAWTDTAPEVLDWLPWISNLHGVRQKYALAVTNNHIFQFELEEDQDLTELLDEFDPPPSSHWQPAELTYWRRHEVRDTSIQKRFLHSIFSCQFADRSEPTEYRVMSWYMAQRLDACWNGKDLQDQPTDHARNHKSEIQ